MTPGHLFSPELVVTTKAKNVPVGKIIFVAETAVEKIGVRLVDIAVPKRLGKNITKHWETC